MSINTKVKRKLLAASGGFCGNPNCHKNLFDFFESGEITNIEELAHIIGQKEDGPREDDELPLTQRDEEQGDEEQGDGYLFHRKTKSVI
jgi:hypothetical protein